MLQNIVTYVNYYFSRCKSDIINSNFVKFCLVYQFLLAYYLNKNATMNYIMLIFDDYKNAFSSSKSIIANHQIFSWAFKEIWNKYKKGRGKVYVFDSPFKQFISRFDNWDHLLVPKPPLILSNKYVIRKLYHRGIASPQNPPAHLLRER